MLTTCWLSCYGILFFILGVYKWNEVWHKGFIESKQKEKTMTYEQATEFWNQSTVDKRFEIMNQVPYMKSITKRHRAIIKWIMENVK